MLYGNGILSTRTMASSTVMSPSGLTSLILPLTVAARPRRILTAEEKRGGAEGICETSPVNIADTIDGARRAFAIAGRGCLVRLGEDEPRYATVAEVAGRLEPHERLSSA
jgi:hypothetical protein